MRPQALRGYDHRHLQKEEHHLLTLEEEDLHDHQDYIPVGQFPLSQTLADLPMHLAQQEMEEAMAQEEMRHL